MFILSYLSFEIKKFHDGQVGGWVKSDFSVNLCPFLKLLDTKTKMVRHTDTKWTQSLTIPLKYKNCYLIESSHLIFVSLNSTLSLDKSDVTPKGMMKILTFYVSLKQTA